MSRLIDDGNQVNFGW